MKLTAILPILAILLAFGCKPGEVPEPEPYDKIILGQWNRTVQETYQDGQLINTNNWAAGEYTYNYLAGGLCRPYWNGSTQADEHWRISGDTLFQDAGAVPSYALLILTLNDSVMVLHRMESGPGLGVIYRHSR